MENYRLGSRNLNPSELAGEEGRVYFIWKIVGIDLEACVAEVGLALQRSRTLPRAPAQALQMYRTARVKDFLKSASSDAILVEGSGHDDETSRPSAMGLASAMLLESIVRSPYASGIHYFCGAHNSPQDPLCGAIGIAKSLLGQLLTLQEYDWSFLHQGWMKALEQGSPPHLFALFGQLVPQLKVPTLICVVDSIQLFATGRWEADVISLVRHLLSVAFAVQHRVNMKLLFTSTGRSHSIGSLFKEQGHNGLIRLRQGGEDDDISVNRVRLEINRSGIGHSPSPGRQPF